MAEIADEIRIVEPVQEHFESYQKACEKMRAYLSDETINDPVGKRESKGFIFAMDSFRVGSQEEFTAKIVDFYKNKRECEATGQPLNRRNGSELFYFVVKGDEIIGSVNALVENYGGYSYSFSGLNPETGRVINCNRYVVNTDTSGRSKDLYKNNHHNRITPGQQNKDNNLADRIKRLRELSASTQVPYKPQPISKENLHGLRYVPNFDKGSR